MYNVSFKYEMEFFLTSKLQKRFCNECFHNQYEDVKMKVKSINCFITNKIKSNRYFSSYDVLNYPF